jgi:hypothetical protein
MVVKDRGIPAAKAPLTQKNLPAEHLRNPIKDNRQAGRAENFLQSRRLENGAIERSKNLLKAKKRQQGLRVIHSSRDRMIQASNPQANDPRPGQNGVEIKGMSHTGDRRQKNMRGSKARLKENLQKENHHRSSRHLRKPVRSDLTNILQTVESVPGGKPTSLLN